MLGDVLNDGAPKIKPLLNDKLVRIYFNISLPAYLEHLIKINFQFCVVCYWRQMIIHIIEGFFHISELWIRDYIEDVSTLLKVKKVMHIIPVQIEA